MSEVSQCGDLGEEDHDALIKMMEAEVDINSTNDYGDTWLIIASRTSLLKSAVPSLLSRNSISSSKNGSTSSRAELFPVNYVNINQANNDGQTALMVAAGMGHADIVQLFIDHEGVQELDVNVRDVDNKTALHYAVTSGSVKCVALLLQVPGIEIDNSLESYIRGNEWSDISKMVQDSRTTAWKKIKDFENLVLKVCNGDLSKLPEPWEPDHVQVKKSMDLIKSMNFTENESFCLDNEKMDDVKWMEFPEQVIFNTINSLLSFYQTDLTELQDKIVSNNPTNLQYFLNLRLIDIMKNPGAMIPSIFEGDGFNAKEILESMTSRERANLINGLVNMSEISKSPSEMFNQGVKFYIDAIARALGLHSEFSVAELQSQFSFCKSIKNYEDAYDINETYWQNMSNQNSRDEDNSCQAKLLSRHGDELSLITAFGEYIVKKGESLCGMGRLEEARELCLRTLKDFEEKTIRMPNGKVIKLSRNVVKSEIGLVIESLYACLSTISVHEFDFEKAFKILDRNMFEGLEARLHAVNNNHKILEQVMTETNSIAKDSLGEDIENSKIIVDPFLKNHYIDGNGKIFVESLDKALRIAKNGDSIFLKNGEHHLGFPRETVTALREKVTVEKCVESMEKIVIILEKSLIIIGESTNKCKLFLFAPFHKRTMSEVQFKRLNIIISFTINVSEGKLSFESCFVNGCYRCNYYFTFDNRQAEIDFHLCCFKCPPNCTVIELKNSESIIKMNIRNCLFSDFDNIVADFRETSFRCGFELNVESCSFLGIKMAIIALDHRKPDQREVHVIMKKIDLGMFYDCFPESQKESKEFMLTYPTSVVLRNCLIEACSVNEEMHHIIDLDNACHVLIESTKFDLKQNNTGLHFANIRRVEINNTIVIREGNLGKLSSLETYLGKMPEEGNLDDIDIQSEGSLKTWTSRLKAPMTSLKTYLENLSVDGCVDDVAIQLRTVHEATIRDSNLKGFYCGVSTKSRPIEFHHVDKICFTGVYNCQLSNMAVCVLLDSRYTRRSIFALSDISLQDSLVGVRVSEMCCRNGSVDVQDAKFVNIASPIVVPKAVKKDAKDEKKKLLGRLEMKNLTFPDGGLQNVSRKKRRDGVITNLIKAGVLDSSVSMPYLETIFNPKGDWLEIANEKDVEPFNLEESKPQSTSDYQSDNDDSVD